MMRTKLASWRTLGTKIGAIVLCALASQCIAAQKHWQSHDYITESFIKIALEREYKETAHPKLVRWEHPIHVFFLSEAGDAALQKKLLRAHMKHLSYITGVPITLDENPDRANIFAIFTRYDQVEDKVQDYIGDPENIRTALNEAICLGNLRVNRNSEITQGTIIIPVDYARQRGKFLDCIVEEITQLLGLPNDSDEVYPSIFNDVSIDSYLSPLDYILLRTLYSPQLHTGMTPNQVRAQMPKILSDLEAQGEIEHAQKRVYQHSLRRFVGE